MTEHLTSLTYGRKDLVWLTVSEVSVPRGGEGVAGQRSSPQGDQEGTRDKILPRTHPRGLLPPAGPPPKFLAPTKTTSSWGSRLQCMSLLGVTFYPNHNIASTPGPQKVHIIS
jgi:hypothetical protein